MAINQCQSGVDDEPEIPHELFAIERNKLAKKGIILRLDFNLTCNTTD